MKILNIGFLLFWLQLAAKGKTAASRKGGEKHLRSAYDETQ